MPRRSLVLFFAVLIIAAMGFNRAFSAEKYQKEMKTLRDIVDQVQANYVEEVDTQKLFDGAYRGMLQSLDPHTQFFDARESTSFNADTEGEFGGLGIEVAMREGILTVIAPIRGTPAYDAGILPGDYIMKIDGKSTERIALEEAVRQLRGKVGSKVTLTVRHIGSPADAEITITRAVIKPAAVEARMLDEKNGIAYLRITSFTAKAKQDFVAAADSLGGPEKIKAMIIDVRQNPGGLLDQAADIADLFIAKGPIVSVKGRRATLYKVFNAKSGDAYESTPLIILMDEFSASASEILAGAIRDDKRGLLVGARSYGKGSVQNVIPLGDGESLKLTTAKYYTPLDKPIEDHQGIMPDIYIPVSREYLIALRAQEREDKLRGEDPLAKLAEDGDESKMIVPKDGPDTEDKPEAAGKAAGKDAGADRRSRVFDIQLKSALNLLRWQMKNPGAQTASN